MISAFQIANIEKGIQKSHLEVGHLDDKRNFTHVTDMVKAYWLALIKTQVEFGFFSFI